MNENKLFISENPITTLDEDLLGRKKYAENIARALTGWDENKSLVIALDGEWGSGKTSLINLAINEVKNQVKNNNKKEIVVVRFNPWIYSETDNLLDSFISELTAAIGKKQNKDLVKKLEYYSELLTLTPQKEQFKTAYNILLSILVLLGITSTQINQFISSIPKFVGNILYYVGIFFFLFVILSPIIPWILSLVHIRSKYNEKSINQLKEEITELLQKTNKKLLIVIDDIDRLTSQEIKQIFRIIRTNADFPNTIYLLAFDRKIIEKNLNVQEKVSGRNYLEKIVQVLFTLPSTPDNKVHNYLSNKLNELFISLSETVYKFFKDNSYYSSIFNSGFKYFFRNIRDVKRYMNSLKFNILQLIQDKTIEVNPIDMAAIEVLRVFEPNYYNYLSKNKSLFTDFKSSLGDEKSFREERKKHIQESFNNPASKKNRTHLQNLIYELFPQTKSIVIESGINFDSSSLEWVQELRICSSKIFDSYFNFIPGGDEKEVSIYELEKAVIASNNYASFNKLINTYTKDGRIINFLTKMLDFSSMDEFFKSENFYNITLALLDSFVNLSVGTSFNTIEWQDKMITNIIYSLLKRNDDLEKNYQLLSDVINKTNSLYGPIYLLCQIRKVFIAGLRIPEIVSDTHLLDLKCICIKKLCSNKYRLQDEANIFYILECWSDWGINPDEYNQYLQELFTNDEMFIRFFDKFEYSLQENLEDVTESEKKFRYNYLKKFYSLDTVKQKIEKLKENKNIYEKHKSSINIFLKDFSTHDDDAYL